ncbi:unnamed protein product [Closterium sp. NIES-53]
MSDLDSAEGAGEAEWAEEAEEAEWAEGAGRAERNASGDGGYGFRGWEYEAEMAMLAESMAEEGIAEGGIAEKGIAEDAKAFRGESWLSSVEWFLSWPLRRLSHPWRKSLDDLYAVHSILLWVWVWVWVWVLVAATILFPHRPSRGHTPSPVPTLLSLPSSASAVGVGAGGRRHPVAGVCNGVAACRGEREGRSGVAL